MAWLDLAGYPVDTTAFPGGSTMPIVILEDEEDIRPLVAYQIQTEFEGEHAGFTEHHLRRALRHFAQQGLDIAPGRTSLDNPNGEGEGED